MTEDCRRWPIVVAWSALCVLAGLVVIENWLALHRPPGSLTLDVDTVFFEAKFQAPALVGALIVSRRPDHPVGWLMLGLGVVAGAGGVLAEASRQLYELHPGFGAVVWMVADTLFKITLLLIGILLLVFPTGHLPSPRWRWLPGTAIVLVGLATIQEFTTPGPISDYITASPPHNPFGSWFVDVFDPRVGVLLFVGFFGFLLVAAASVVFRFRRAEPEVRLQLKWVMLAASLLVASIVAGNLYSNVGRDQWAPLPFEVAGLVAALGMMLAIAIAILRHRLFDIDLVISRTVAYVALAAVITVVYVGVVAGLGSLLAMGSSSQLVLAVVATAGIAAAFQPLRTRLEALAHRLVYGDRARPYEVLAEFTARVGASQDVNEALPAMARLLAEGTASDCATVWLRESGDGLPGASWPDDQCVAPASATRIVEVRQGGEVLGRLAVKRASGQQLTPTEERLMDSLAAQAGLVLRNAGLQDALRQRLEDLRASRQRLVSAQAEERRRLERDLHDGAQSDLVSLRMKLGLAEGVALHRPEELQPLLKEMQVEMGEALESLRTLARGVYPPLLESEGLGAALTARARLTPLRVAVQCGSERYQRDVEAAFFFCCSEALQNTVKHAGATRGSIRVWPENGKLYFEVKDDGHGFPTHATTGGGLQNMRDRLEALAGEMAVSSTATQGTSVTGWLPLR